MQIVLADASRIALRMLTTMLTARGHVVHASTDGAEALKFISANAEIDALITSIELPSLTGFELSWEVRLLSVARHRPLYIIVMSTNSDEKTLSEALDSGADDFIRKPPSATALYARLRAAERLIGSETELIRLADRDPLTELLNRRAFFAGGERAIDRAQVGRLSAIMADIDHFKSTTALAMMSAIRSSERSPMKHRACRKWSAGWAARSLPFCLKASRLNGISSLPRICGPNAHR
jgi:PleD family two-component response regulator